MTWRCVLLAGPAGSGKTTICRLGHRAMLGAWGHPAAAIDIDELYANVDPLWELSYDDGRNAMVLSQATQLTLSLFQHGWPTVMVCGNSLLDPADTAALRDALAPVAAVHHVTLTPPLDAVLARAAGDRNPERLRADVEVHTAKVHAGTARLDNSSLSPEQALNAIVDLVRSGAGRLPPPSAG